MNFLDSINQITELKNLINLRNAEVNLLKKLDLIKQVQNLRMQLGIVKNETAQVNLPQSIGSVKTEPLDETQIEPLATLKGLSVREQKKEMEKYLNQFKGKTIISSDGKTIRFNAKIAHFINDALYSNDLAKYHYDFIPEAVGKFVEVLTKGQFVGREELYKVRNNDSFVAFHAYRKSIELKDGTQILLQVKAGELDSGILEAGAGLIGYSLKDVNRTKGKNGAYPPQTANDSVTIAPHSFANLRPYVQDQRAISENCNLILDNAQAVVFFFIEFLEVTDLNGNPINFDDELDVVKAEVKPETLSKELNLPENPTKSDLSKAVSDWLRQNAQGKTITTSDGKKVFFNRGESVEHLAYDGRRSELAAKSMPYVIDVFTSGQFDRREELTKGRNDFVAFHCYRKTVQIDDKNVLLEAKAGEKENGELEALPPLVAYHQKILTLDSAKEKGHFLPSIKSMDLNGGLAPKPYGLRGNNTLILDNVQSENALLTIIEVTDLNGNPVQFDNEQAVQEPQKIAKSEQVDKSQLFDYNREGISQSKRQQENNTAMDIVRAIWAGDQKIEDLTAEQKIALSKYSGRGGGLEGIDGKAAGDKGSQYEYYTPKPIAESMWEMLKDAGFTGGKVLDPCAGTGIFAATAPDNILMENVELDKTSGTINKAMFESDTHKTTISAFEDYAVNTPDESFDAVITNVPFGTVADRGGNQFKDPEFKGETLDHYFILRCLRKLKPNGLAVFMCSEKVLTGLGKSIAKRRDMAMMAEFIGSYRLPNKVFHNAGAVTARTDVLVFKKHSTQLKKRINEIATKDSKGLELLEKANVLWKPFISGKYYKEKPQNVLGTIGQIKTKYGLQESVENDASIADIAKLMRKLGGSRIDFEMLNAIEGEFISYNEGDCVRLDGVLMEYKRGQWVKAEVERGKPKKADLLAQTVAPYGDPLSIIEDKQPIDVLYKAYEEATDLGINTAFFPQWFRELIIQYRAAD